MNKPTYTIIFEDIKNQIHRNELKPGDPIPSENTLCQQYSTSRMTVRKAIASLISFGYVYSMPGVGSFVCSIDPDIYKLRYNETKNITTPPDQVEVLDITVINPDIDLALKMNKQPDEYVVLIKRKYLREGIVLAYDEKFIPYEPGIPLIEKEINYATFPDIVASKVSPFVIKKSIVVCTKKADREMADLLHIPQNDPVVQVEQQIFDERFHVIGFSRMFYRYEYFSMKATSGSD